MANVFSRVIEERGLFKDERFLYPEFIPEKLPHREKEIETIASCLKPLAEERKGRNLFISGTTGIGKTACVKYVLRELEDYTSKAKGHYINCFQTNTKYGILSEITNFMGFPLPRRGLSSDEAYAKIKEAAGKCGFMPIVVLDEFDRSIAKGEGSELLYDLLRIAEFGKKPFTVVLISNDEGLTSKLDDRVRSSLMAENMKFEAYSPLQLKEILAERCGLAFHDDIVEKDSIALAAAHSAKLGGDARVAIGSLLAAGRIAQKENAKSLRPEHLRKAFEKVDAASVLKAIPFLTATEGEMLEVIAKNDGITSGELYCIIDRNWKNPPGERMKREIIEKLIGLRVIKAEEISLGNRGKTRKIKLNASPKAVLEKLGKEAGK